MLTVQYISSLRGADPCFITNFQSPSELAYVPKDIAVAENLFIMIGSRIYLYFTNNQEVISPVNFISE